MNDEFQDTEASLAVLKPARLDGALLSRLLDCAEGDPTALHRDESQLESHLRTLAAPARLPAAFMAKLEHSVAGAAFPVDEKILLFPKPPAASAARRRSRPMVAAAAAVALCGAATALLLPAGFRDAAPAPVAGNTGAARTTVATAPAGPALPANFARGLSGTRDEGVVWHSKDRSHRVVRVEYIDRVTVRDKHGKTVELEQPRVEYLIVPEQID